MRRAKGAEEWGSTEEQRAEESGREYWREEGREKENGEKRRTETQLRMKDRLEES